ncbi:MAG TPA: hypothetical protein VE621_17245 [Bryobacteraceae bacterium]|nr:hypothetical protein [Bryobacteraceae bacterium]
MATSTNKKVQIRRFEREDIAAFVNPVTYIAAGSLEYLTIHGTIGHADLREVKMVEFVRDFSHSTEEKRAFLTRPKLEGLWVRFRFRDADVLEAILPNDLLQTEVHGFSGTPPDFSGNRQKIFIPRAALQAVQVLGVIGTPLKPRRPAARKAPAPGQIDLFDKS